MSNLPDLEEADSIVVKKGNDTKEIEIDKIGDGKAVFLGEGTHEEFEDMQKEDNGTKGIFGL